MDVKSAIFEHVKNIDLSTPQGMMDFDRISKQMDSEMANSVDEWNHLFLETFSIRREITNLFKASLSLSNQQTSEPNRERVVSFTEISEDKIEKTKGSENKMVQKLNNDFYEDILNDSHLYNMRFYQNFAVFDFKLNEKISLQIKMNMNGEIVEIVPLSDQEIEPNDVKLALNAKKGISYGVVSVFERNIFAKIENYFNFSA